MVGAVKDTHLSLEVLASTVGVALLETHVFSSSVAAKKLHRANSSRFNALRVCLSWVKCSGTHQEDKNLAWWKNTLEPTVYLYDGNNSVEEVDSTGNVLARYTQGSHIDEPFAELRSGTISYYEDDGGDSVTSLTSSAGAVANSYAYDSFGKLTASTGMLVNPFSYTTREFDQETSIYYYRARYYDPNVGRFISEDPIGFGGGTHFYRYASNNPVLFDDPLGLWRNTGKPASPEDNTIICNGLGGIAIQIPKDQDLSCGIGNCIWRHENQHRREALASNPGICRNVAKGIQVDFSNNQERKAGEIAASTVEINCLEDALKKANCDHCKKDIQNYKKEVEDYRSYYARQQ